MIAQLVKVLLIAAAAAAADVAIQKESRKILFYFVFISRNLEHVPCNKHNYIRLIRRQLAIGSRLDFYANFAL